MQSPDSWVLYSLLLATLLAVDAFGVLAHWFLALPISLFQMSQPVECSHIFILLPILGTYNRSPSFMPMDLGNRSVFYLLIASQTKNTIKTKQQRASKSGCFTWDWGGELFVNHTRKNDQYSEAEFLLDVGLHSRLFIANLCHGEWRLLQALQAH